MDQKDQDAIKNCPIILAGSGIGSVVAECALRLGFENMTIVDFDEVELSNLNRQNYTEKDINTKKVDALRSRLLSINNNASIAVYNSCLTPDNVFDLVLGHDIAVNALDFSSNIPLTFDKICQELNMHIIHPYNLGWGGLVTVIDPKGLSLQVIADESENFSEINMVEYAVGYMKFWGKSKHWIEDVIRQYKDEKEDLPPPQLSIGAWLVASMCTNLLYNICTGKSFKQFPEFYLSDILED